jgi:hypothetical protein
MTAASELNNAAVVELESARNELVVNVQTLDNRNDALQQKERCSSRDDTGFKIGSGAAGTVGIVEGRATLQLRAREEVLATPDVPATTDIQEIIDRPATSGSKAAFNSIAASVQAMGLPVSICSRAISRSFSKSAKFSATRAARISPIKLHVQQNPVQLWPQVPGRFLRASCAA